MRGRLVQLSFFAGLSLAAACGGAGDTIEPIDPGNGLSEPPPVGTPDAGKGSTSSSSSTSSGAAASSSGGAQPDSGPPPTEADCDPNLALSPFFPIGGLPDSATWLRLTGDELRVYFVMPQGAGLRIMSASRGSKDAAFANVVELGTNVNFGNDTSAPFITDDDLSLYFSVGTTNWQVTRTELALPFGDAVSIRTNANSEIRARGDSLIAYAAVFGFNGEPWITHAQPTGADDKPLVLGIPTWFEPRSAQLWSLHGSQAHIFRWNGGTDWADLGDTPFQVTWTSPNACRMYGIVDGKPAVRSRVPS